MFLRFVYVVEYVRISFPLWLNISVIFLYLYTPICLLIMHLLMHIWAVSTFWLLWMVLLWISVYIYLFVPIFCSSGYVPGSGIAGSYDISIFNFGRAAKCFPQWLNHFMFPPVMSWGSSFSTSSLTSKCFLTCETGRITPDVVRIKWNEVWYI